MSNINIFMRTGTNEIRCLSKLKWYECHEIKSQMRSAILNRMEKKQSRLLPSGYPFGGLIKLQLAWGTHGLYWENNEVETKKLLGGKLCNLVLSEIYISRIRPTFHFTQQHTVKLYCFLFCRALNVMFYEMCTICAVYDLLTNTNNVVWIVWVWYNYIIFRGSGTKSELETDCFSWLFYFSL